jgi:hypothetical protein
MAPLSTVIRQFYHPAPERTANNISNLSGKVFIVTTGNVGTDKETCKQLSNKHRDLTCHLFGV